MPGSSPNVDGGTTLTAEDILTTPLTGFVTTDYAGVVAADSIRGAIGKLQARYLTADLNVYVRIDGNNLNNGLTNIAGGAFRTIQRAVQFASQITFGSYKVIVRVGDGDYDEVVGIVGFPGKTPNRFADSFQIIGNEASPGNVIIRQLYISGSAGVLVSGMTVALGASANCGSEAVVFAFRCPTLNSTTGSYLTGWDVELTAPSSEYDYGYALKATQFGTLDFGGLRVVLGRDYSNAFAVADGGCVSIYDQPVGSATGKKFNVAMNGIINTYGGGVNFLPGTVAGTTATGGQYV